MGLCLFKYQRSREGSVVMTLDAYIIPIGIARWIKGSLRVAMLPRGNIGRVANPHVGMDLRCVCEVLHLLHLAVGEGHVVDGYAGGGDADEVWKVALKRREGVGDDEDVVYSEAWAWRTAWGGSRHGRVRYRRRTAGRCRGGRGMSGQHATLVRFCFDGELEALCEGKCCTGETFGGIDDNVGERSIDGELDAKVAQRDALWGACQSRDG